MVSTLTFYRTSIGKKVIMAVTGLILFGFVVVHMLGNLKAFQGQDYFNNYALFLREVGNPVLGHEQALWLTRIILLSAVVLHIVAAVQLTKMEYDSRQVRYTRFKPVQATLASRTMIWGGIVIFLFIIYHILHLTTGTVHPDFHHEDAYGNMVRGFQQWYVSLFYILAVGALGMHLYHGAWSMFQTLGLNSSNYNHALRWFSIIVAIFIFVGYAVLPLAVMAGILTTS
jgi:succinate dehydrogenase / fumarate reductase cytochrome b subunit